MKKVNVDKYNWFTIVMLRKKIGDWTWKIGKNLWKPSELQFSKAFKYSVNDFFVDHIVDNDVHQETYWNGVCTEYSSLYIP